MIDALHSIPLLADAPFPYRDQFSAAHFLLLIKIATAQVLGSEVLGSGATRNEKCP